MNNKPNLLLLHGALGSKDQFGGLKKYLTADFEVLDFNFSGHGGKAFSSESFSIAAFTDEVFEFLLKKRIGSLAIFGYSMGGYIALNLALKHPEKVDKIFTLGTKMDWNPAVAAKEVQLLNPEIIESKVPRFAQALQKRHAPIDWKEVLRKTARMMTDLGNGEAIPLDDFSMIRQPVKIGLGELDNMVTLEESSAVATILPNGELEIFKGFKHPLEQIDLNSLAESILLFFKETNVPK